MSADEFDTKRSHWPISILSCVASLVNLLMPLVLVRYLTADQVGIFKIFFLYLTMVPALSLVAGFLDGIAYWSGQEEPRRHVALQMSATMMFSIGILFALLVGILHGPVSSWLGWPDSHALIFAVSLFGAIAGTYLEESVIAQGRVWLGALFFSGFEILRAILIVTSVLVYPDVLTALIVHASVSVVKTIVSVAIGWHIGLVGLDWDPAIFKEVLRYAMPVSGAWIFGIFVSHADQFLLSFYIPPNEFAYYTIGCLLIPPLFILEHSICRVMIPQMSEAFAQNDQSRAARLYREASENIAFLVIPAATGLFVFAEPIIELLFTSAYASAAGYLRLFAFSYLVLILPFDAVARARAVSGWLFRSFVIFSIFSLVLTVALIIPYGAYGALSALLIVRFSMRAYALLYMRSSVGWSLSDSLPLVPLAQFAVLSIGLGLLSEAAQGYFRSQVDWFLVCGFVFVVLYFAILSVWKVRRRTDYSRPKRLLLVVPTLGIGGMERMVLNLGRAVRAEGVQVHVFAYDCDPDSSYPDLTDEFVRARIKVTRYGKTGKKFFAFGAVWKMVRYVNSNDIPLIHSHNLGSLMHASLVKLISLHPIRIVHTQHSFVHLHERKRYATYEKIFSRFAAHIVCVSEDTREQYLKLGIPAERLSFIPNGVALPDEPPLERSKRIAQRPAQINTIADTDVADRLHNYEDSFWLLNLARLDSIKGQLRLLSLWSELSPDIREQCCLLFVGPEAEKGFFDAFLPALERCPDAERVFYCGPTLVPADWYRAADVYVSGSTFEGMPLGPLEALGHGLPCLLSDIPGHRFLGERVRYLSYPDCTGANQIVAELLAETKAGAGHSRMTQIAKEIQDTFGIGEMARRYCQTYFVQQESGGDFQTALGAESA